MADSFFGFNTTIPDDDGGGEHEDEDEYDALNDETFGEAMNGDWEGMHEKFVRLDKFDTKKSSNDDEHDSDLELNLSRVGLEDCDITQDEIGGRLQLDPSVWSSPAKSLIPQKTDRTDIYGLYGNPDMFLRQNFSQPFNNFPQLLKSSQQTQQKPQTIQATHNILGQFPQSQMPMQQSMQPSTLTSSKMCTVEDIERSIRNQQQSKQTPTQLSGNSLMQLTGFSSLTSSNPENLNHSQVMANPMMNHRPPPGLSAPQLPPQQQQQQQQQQMHQPIPRPPFPFQPNRMPPGFPPMHMMGGGPPSSQPPPNMPPRHMPPNMQIPMMPPPPVHTNFGPMRPPGPPPPLPMQQQRPPPPNFLTQHFSQNMQNLQNSVNQFNQRLVQEIQLNHPLLAQLNRNNNNNMNNSININNHSGNNNHNNSNNHNNNKNGNYQQQQQNHRHDNNNINNYDEYSNLMSTRDKQWLIGIQLMQLNTDTPYIDDFYFTVYKDRQKQKKGGHESKSYKDNTANHPFTQPKGHHAQLLMLLGKNGTNQRNGHHNRERKNSETSSISNKNDKDQPHRTYTPLQFENSLGKLQCGSVTAPRKIIDMDIVGPELTNSMNSNIEISVQRRSRQLLLHIETLYKLVLKMEDLENPIAIAAAVIMREKKEQERQLALKQALMQNNDDNVDTVKLETGIGNIVNDKTAPLPPPETFNELLPKLLSGLTSDKVVAMMGVRKGKTLLRRVMPLIRDQIQKWDVWCDIFSTLYLVVRKDPTDTDGYLINFYPEFRNQIQYAGMDEIIKISKLMTPNDKKLNYIVHSKFCILSIIAMILRVEQFYNISNELVNNEQKDLWLKFLNLLSNCSNIKLNNNLNNNNKSTSSSATVKTPNEPSDSTSSLDSDLIKTLNSHLSRFNDENLQIQQLLNILTNIELK